jgi:cytochrome c-type biogenesis protein CcmH/NrfG
MPTPSGALRPLHAAEEEIARLRRGDATPEAAREAVVRVAHAVEASMRRLLRDDPDGDLELRLRALDPEEISPDEVVAELRRRNLLSLELAAGFHELIGVRARARRGDTVTPADTALALRTADGLCREADLPPPARPRGADLPPVPDDATLLAPPSAVPPAHRTRRPAPLLATAAVLLLVLLGGLLWWRSGNRHGGTLAEGVSLFRSGDLVGAQARFETYSAANPEDATALLYLARIHRRAGRRVEAAEVLRRGIAAAPEDADLHRELGFLLLDAGRPVQAAERFRLAIRLHPEGAEAWIGLVRAQREAGRLDLAERVLEQAPAEVRARLVGAGVPAGSTPR